LIETSVLPLLNRQPSVVVLVYLVPATEPRSTWNDRGGAAVVDTHARRVSGRTLADICRVHPVTCQHSRHRVPSSRACLPITAHGRGLRTHCF